MPKEVYWPMTERGDATTFAQTGTDGAVGALTLNVVGGGQCFILPGQPGGWGGFQVWLHKDRNNDRLLSSGQPSFTDMATMAVLVEKATIPGGLDGNYGLFLFPVVAGGWSAPYGNGFAIAAGGGMGPLSGFWNAYFATGGGGGTLTQVTINGGSNPAFRMPGSPLKCMPWSATDGTTMRVGLVWEDAAGVTQSAGTITTALAAAGAIHWGNGAAFFGADTGVNVPGMPGCVSHGQILHAYWDETAAISEFNRLKALKIPRARPPVTTEGVAPDFTQAAGNGVQNVANGTIPNLGSSGATLTVTNMLGGEPADYNYNQDSPVGKAMTITNVGLEAGIQGANAFQPVLMSTGITVLWQGTNSGGDTHYALLWGKQQITGAWPTVVNFASLQAYLEPNSSLNIYLYRAIGGYIGTLAGSATWRLPYFVETALTVVYPPSGPARAYIGTFPVPLSDTNVEEWATNTPAGPWDLDTPIHGGTGPLSSNGTRMDFRVWAEAKSLDDVEAFLTNQALSITGISPSIGYQGEQLTATGVGFVANTKVFFDGVQAATTYVNSTMLTVIAPPHALGTVPVTVANV